jgi:hypothetical protein
MERAAFLALIVLIILQVLGAARYMSLTVDEAAHLPAGYSHWKTGDFRLGRENPPLVKLISSFPLLFLNPDLPLEHPSWQEFEQFGFGKEFFFHANKNANQIIFWGRLPIALLSLLLAFFVFKWAKELYGRIAGLFALFLYSLEPNILAHSSLATLDLGLTLFMFLAIYAFWRFLREPRHGRMVVAGITFGLAMAAKYSAILLVPMYFILVLVAHSKRKENHHLQFSFLSSSFISSMALIFVIGFMVIFASYGFKVTTLISPLEPQGTHLRAFTGTLSEGWKQTAYNLATTVPLPAGEWLRGFISQMLHASEGHDAYLMGAYSDRGWWYYYPIAFVLKTPIPLLVLIALSIFLYRKKSAFSPDQYFLLVPAGVILLASMTSKISIGVRYILPMYPFLIVYASSLFSLRKGRLTGLLVGALCLWYLVGTLGMYPHYLAYFNEFVGGPANGYKYLADSNLDWGQDLKGLRSYALQRGIKKMKLSYFGTADPSYYGLDYQEISEEETHSPSPGTYGISVNNLLNVFSPDKERFSWLKKLKLSDRVGYSIFIYEVK